jgi:hypothetical protein
MYIATHLVMAGCIIFLYLYVKADESTNENEQSPLIDRLYTRGLETTKRITIAYCRMAASILVSYIKR